MTKSILLYIDSAYTEKYMGLYADNAKGYDVSTLFTTTITTTTTTTTITTTTTTTTTNTTTTTTTLLICNFINQSQSSKLSIRAKNIVGKKIMVVHGTGDGYYYRNRYIILFYTIVTR